MVSRRLLNLKKIAILSFLLFSTVAWSQLCGGSFGDPVFKEDFGNVETPLQKISPALSSPAYTSYSYTSSYPPDDGYYTVINLTGRGPGNWAWITIPDHTLDTTGRYGNMLVVNASHAPGEFYRRRVSNLCPNQVYLFSAWGINLNTRDASGHHSPDVTIQIRDLQGNVLVSDNKVFPQNEQWQEFSVEFRSSIASGDVDVVLINNAPGGTGNDLAIDDISFRACGPSLTTTTDTNVFKGVCDNFSSINIKAHVLSNSIVNPYFIWQKSTDKGSTWADLTSPSSTDSYLVPSGTYNNGDLFRFIVAESTSISSLNCRIASAPLEAKVYGYPSAPDVSSINICKNAALNLEIPGNNILWYTMPTGGVGSNKKPTINTSQLGTIRYWVSQTVNGCESPRSEVVIAINDIPQPPIVSNITLCQNSATNPLSATGSNLLWYSTQNSNDGKTVAPNPSTKDVGDFSFWVSQTTNGCESLRAEIKVTVLPTHLSNTLFDITICDDETKTLDAGPGFAAYEWNANPPTFSRYLKVSKLGDYQVNLTNANGCIVSQSVKVTAGITPVIEEIISGDHFIEVNVSGGNPPYFYSLDLNNWQGSNRFDHLKAGIYTVYVKSKTNSCTAVAQAQVIFIPNTITPNGDGFNDEFEILNVEYFKEAQVIIYDRFGVEIFSSKKQNSLVWDGKRNGRNVNYGTYWYFIDLGNKFTKSGWILVKNRN